MFYAYDLTESKFIDANDEDSFKKILQKREHGRYVCPYYYKFDDKEIPVTAVCRSEYRNFFRLPKGEETYPLYNKEVRDTEEHYQGCLLLKKHMYRKLNSMGFKVLEKDIYLEYPLKEVKRIADVYFGDEEFKLVYEFQKSPITLNTLIERTEDYEKMGIQTQWFLYEKACTEEITNWCLEHGYGGYEVECTSKTKKEILTVD